MSEKYNNKLLVIFNSLQSDLKEKKISEKEFNFLLGLALQKEVGTFVSEKVEVLLPSEERENSLTLISYETNRKLNHAS